jgi:hypothetical protein
VEKSGVEELWKKVMDVDEVMPGIEESMAIGV